jgi:hypothetical protein
MILTPEQGELAKIVYTNVLLLTEQMMEGMEALSKTTKYRQLIKKYCNLLYNEIKALSNDEITRLLDIDEKAAYHHMNRQSGIVRQIIYMKPSDVGMYHEMLKKLQESPEFVLDRLNIIKGDSSKIGEMTEKEDFINEIINLDIKTIRQVKRYSDGLKNILIN